MSKPFRVGDKVMIFINDIMGKLPAVITRDRTSDPCALNGLRLGDERVFEVRHTFAHLAFGLLR